MILHIYVVIIIKINYTIHGSNELFSHVPDGSMKPPSAGALQHRVELISKKDISVGSDKITTTTKKSTTAYTTATYS